MKIIKEIVEEICDELEGAEHYAKQAMKYKASDRPLADMYAKLADVELSHVSTLHEQAARLIKAKRDSEKEVPANMQAIWDWEHEKSVDSAARVRAVLAMYRES